MMTNVLASRKKSLHQFIFLFVVSIVLTQLSFLSFANDVNELEHDAFDALDKDSIVVLDVRTPAEFAQGHVPGAINIPLATLEDNLGLLKDKSKAIVAYCRSGRRAGKALDILAANEYSNLHHLVGDMKAWEDAGKEIVVPKQ